MMKSETYATDSHDSKRGLANRARRWLARKLTDLGMKIADLADWVAPSEQAYLPRIDIDLWGL